MIARARALLQRYIDRKTIRNWIHVVILFVSLIVVLGNAVRGVENELFELMIGTGLLTGWLLTCTSLPGGAFVAIATVLGTSLVLVRVGRLGKVIALLLSQLGIYLARTVARLWDRSGLPDSEILQWAWVELGEKLGTLGIRLWNWIANLVQGQPLFDPVAIAIVWGVLSWGLAVWTMWAIFRQRKPILALLPPIAFVAISLVYIGKPPHMLVIMLGAGISLVVHLRHDTRTEHWERDQLSYASIIQPKIARTAILLSLGLMLIATIAPSISIRQIANLIREMTAERVKDEEIAKSLGLESKSEPRTVDVLDRRQSAGLPNRHLIGSGEKLSDEVVMIIRVQEREKDRADLTEEGPITQPYYWRNLSYDRYVGRGWASRDSIEQKYAAGEQTIPSWSDKYRLIRQEVEFIEDLNGLLHTAGMPLSVDQDFKVAWRIREQDLNAYDIFGATVKDNSYRADSLLPDYSEAELRNAGQDYPGWVSKRYLTLPREMPERVLALARDLTATEPTPYDRALAIEQYLRTFPYTLDLPQPPIDQDITDYFLFGAQRGYCDYYATAMVVLARASGIPARLATGYIGGYYDESEDAYIVTADLAHAWPEVYFPGYGWISFEPTGGRPAIDRPAQPIPKLPANFEPSFEPLVPEQTLSPGRRLLIGLTIISVIVTGPLLWWAISDFWLAHLPVDKLAPKLYRRIRRHGRWLELPSSPGDTPDEFKARLIGYLHQIGRGSIQADWLLDAVKTIDTFIDNYILLLYSPHETPPTDSQALMHLFRQIRPRLWLLWVLKRAYPNRLMRIVLWDQAPVTISPTRQEKL